MSQSERKKFIEKLHWEEDYSLRDIAKLLNKSWWWIINFKRNNDLKVKKRVDSMNDKFGGHSVNWKGGRHKIHEYWVVYKPEHPNASKRGYIPEHRLVMSDKLKRPLTDEEVVHHIDGNKENNHPDNLQLMTKGGRGKFHGIPTFCPNCNFELKQTFE